MPLPFPRPISFYYFYFSNLERLRPYVCFSENQPVMVVCRFVSDLCTLYITIANWDIKIERKNVTFRLSISLISDVVLKVWLTDHWLLSNVATKNTPHPLLPQTKKNKNKKKKLLPIYSTAWTVPWCSWSHRPSACTTRWPGAPASRRVTTWRTTHNRRASTRAATGTTGPWLCFTN